MLLSPSRVVCGVTGRHNNWLKMRWRRNGLDCCGLSFYRVETENGSGSGANYLKAIIRNKSTEVGKEESSRVEIRDGSLFSSSLSQSSSIPSPPKAISSSVPKNAPYRISDEIYEAIKNNSKPVVALESAIITHGMPYPDNIQTAMHLQTIIRQQGVIPATVGVIKGQLTVGLSDEDIETLGSSAKNGSTIGPSRTPVVKVSRRDLPYVLSHKLYGGTTVSGTIIAAVKAHIPIFVTGGLGGVHRGAESTFDISADLKELGRSPIAVISAGVKSILDIGKTLEYLETEGVCVCVLKKEEEVSALDGNQSEGGSGSVGRRTKFPSFFTQESPFTAPYWVQNEMEAAQLLHSSFQFGLQSGILIAVPIPKEFAASGERIDKAIGEALERARRDGINGKDMTPFLLGIVSELTGGKSLEANKHLVENNARVGAQIALQLARLRKDPNDTLSVENLSSGSGGSTGPGSLQSNHRHNDAPTEKGNASDRKLTSSKSTLNLKNLSHQSPIRNPTDKRSISTSTQTSTRLPSSAPLTFSHTSNPTFPPSTSVSVLSTSNPAVASSGHPHGPTSFKYNDNGNVMIDFDRNKRESGIGALVVEQQSHGRFVAATLEQESTSKSESKRGNAFEKTVAHDRRDRNGGDDKSIKSKGTGSCVEVDEIQVPGNKEPPNHPFSSTTRPVVIGGTSLDLVLRVQEENIVSDGRTHKARIEAVPGGVARNVTEALEKLGHKPLFISAVGNDLFGREILRNFSDNRMDTRGILRSRKDNATAIYSALLNHEGECLFGLGDMTVHSEISPTALEEHAQDIRQASIVLVDGNIPQETMTAALQICSQHSVPVWFEPTEVRKAKKILEVPREYWQSLRYISPNLWELISIAGHGTELENESMEVDYLYSNVKSTTTRVGSTSKSVIVIDDVGTTDWTNTPNTSNNEIQIQTDRMDGKRRIPLSRLILRCFHLFSGLEIILLTRGKQGFYIIQRRAEGQRLGASHFPAPELSEGKLKSVSGAGDCLNAGFISGLLGKLSLQECGERGTHCAKKSLESVFNVPTSFDLIKE